VPNVRNGSIADVGTGAVGRWALPNLRLEADGPLPAISRRGGTCVRYALEADLLGSRRQPLTRTFCMSVLDSMFEHRVAATVQRAARES
jgi:hypothetical protein